MSLLLDEAVAYSDSAKRWHYAAGSGKTGFVSAKSIQAEVEKHLAASSSTLQALTEQVYAGGLSIAEWQAAVALELKNAHLAQAMLGAGGRSNMGAAEFGRVGQELRGQYSFLRNFAQEIADGKVSQGQANVRVGMYVDESYASYWNEVRAQANRAEDRSLPTLRQSPGDGGTQCLTNCLCSLAIHEDGSCDWVLDGGEHCPDCEALAAGGPYKLK